MFIFFWGKVCNSFSKVTHVSTKVKNSWHRRSRRNACIYRALLFAGQGCQWMEYDRVGRINLVAQGDGLTAVASPDNGTYLKACTHMWVRGSGQKLTEWAKDNYGAYREINNVSPREPSWLNRRVTLGSSLNTTGFQRRQSITVFSGLSVFTIHERVRSQGVPGAIWTSVKAVPWLWVGDPLQLYHLWLCPRSWSHSLASISPWT